MRVRAEEVDNAAPVRAQRADGVRLINVEVELQNVTWAVSNARQETAKCSLCISS